MSVHVFGYSYNEAEIMPFFLRHYFTFADKITIWDDQSTDGTRAILAGAGIDLRDWPFEPGLNDQRMLEFSQEAYKIARGSATWALWVDMDEFVWAEDINASLSECERQGWTVPKVEGWNMVGHGVPEDDGSSQIYELNKFGVHAPCYGKPIVFRPELDMKWKRGRHEMEGEMEFYNQDLPPMFKLLHYRYMGYDYTKMRNARNYERVGSDKGAAWSCAPDFDGEDLDHSPTWAERAMFRAVKVIP